MKNVKDLMVRGLVGLGLAVGLTASSPPASASEPAQRVAIDSFRGPRGQVVQDAVETALLRRYFLVPDTQVVAAARKSGVRLTRDEDFAEVGRSLNVAAFVSATIKWRRHWKIEMVVRDGETGEPVARYDLTDRHLADLAATVARAAPRKLQVALAGGRAAAADADGEPQLRVKLPPAPRAAGRDQADDDEITEKTLKADRRPRAEKDRAKNRDDDDDDENDKPPVKAKAKKANVADDDDDKPPVKAKAKKADADESVTSDESPAGPSDALPHPYLELGVGGKVFSRAMSFTDNFSNVPAYRLDRATAVTVDVAFHPFAMAESTKDTWAAGLGITGNVTYALGITTEQAGSAGRARTEVHGYEAGLRYRASLGPVDLLPRGSYIADTFIAGIGDLSPDVSYHVLRLGTGIQLGLSRHAFMRASGDYLHVLSAGRLNDPDRFPRAITRGVDVSLGAGYAFTDSLEGWLAVGLRRYGYDMKVQPSDGVIVGGAVDEYLSMTTGLTYRPSLGGR